MGKLEPTWERVALEHKDWERTVGFKFAEVNCVAQADLCEDNEVVSYPTMKLYVQSRLFAKFRNRPCLE
jgi:protein disulfide-isomerase